MARAAAHSTRKVRTIQACTVKVEDKEKRKSHDTGTIFAAGRWSPHLHPSMYGARYIGAWRGVGMQVITADPT